jgi:hypothetical protein
MPASLDDKLDAIARQPFRARFHLRGRDRGRELSREEVGYVVDVICRWIEREVASAPDSSPAAQGEFSPSV